MQNYKRRFLRHRHPRRGSIYGHRKHAQNTRGHIFGGSCSGCDIFCIVLSWITVPGTWWLCISFFISW